MKKLLFTLILIPTMFHLHAQDEDAKKQKKHYALHDIQRNSLYVEYQGFYLSAFYERSIPVGDKTGIIAGGGIQQGVAWTSETNMVGKIAVMLGGKKHFFEGGIMLAIPAKEMNILAPMAGYRYQSRSGFLLRVDVTLFTSTSSTSDGPNAKDGIEFHPVPGISLGYSF